MRKTITYLFFFVSVTISAQKQYAKEFSFVNDNDLYISTKQDRYYTNGMFFSYRYLSEKSSKKIIKKTYKLQVGHEMYTPYKAIVATILEHDRPFAGYLYGGFTVSNFYNNNSVLKLSTQIGIIGPSAYSEELMEVIHDIYDFREADGWKYQISDAFAMNFNGTYVKNLRTLSSSIIDVNWHNQLKIGTVYTNFSTGFYSRIGFLPLENLINSIAYNGNLNSKKSNFNNTPEAFFFIKPLVNYVVYDATIEGSFFNNSSEVTYGIEPFLLTTEFGIRFTANRFNFGYSATYHSKKLKSVRVPKGNFYGSIQINYLFN
ncbi:uncharacterized protein DUF2219 [Tenacibaculum adriaticum]|uniref:Uncharacterized protein DUF2219 n=1 Tax=Tenacibaculum adriaticum TaxID=413713 RepID=A0A5S5DKR3_9FLAO|nr:lipid A deacylase LpxR family protein [Tenacibaculum adriaticum]TYP96507.1 uncharacterized protein DUF2219 [Tenacibaculum adriaticum]